MGITRLNWWLSFAIICFGYSPCLGQTYSVTPYLSATTAIKETVTEIGPQFNVDNGTHSTKVRLYARLPLSDKTNTISTIDRSTDTWRLVGSAAFGRGNSIITSTDTILRGNYISLQGEFGRSKFAYYPTGVKTAQEESPQSSFAAEVKGYTYQASKQSSWQYCLQGRLRFARDYKAADEVGVIKPAAANGLVTSSNMVVAPPSVVPVFSPAVSFHFAHDKYPISYAPVIYYDVKGYKGANSPFQMKDAGNADNSGVQRLRLEFWVFGHPADGAANITIGASPYISWRTAGSDDNDKVILGGQITIRTTNLFLFFF
jgi:hypothetical protein